MMKKGISYRFFVIFTLLALFFSVLFSCKNPATLDSNNQKIDITEIQIGAERFSKGINLDSLDGKEFEILSAGSLKITAKAKGGADFIKLYLNKQPSQNIPFINGTAVHTIEISKNTDIKLQITSLHKKEFVYSFTVKVKKTVSPENPPANGEQPGNGNVQQPPVNPPANGEQPGNGNTQQPPAKPPVEYNPAENDIPEIPVSSIKIVASDEIPVEPDGDTSFKITLTAGTDYTIKTEVLPEDAHNKELSYIFVDEDYKKYLRVSEQGVLTVLDKPQSSNPPWVRIESKSNPNVAVNLTVYVQPDPNPIIKDWLLTGGDVVQGEANNQIKVSGDKASSAHLSIIKGSTTSYQFEVKPNDNSITVNKTSSGSNVGDVDEYQITINKNNTVWEKKSSIVFYKNEYNEHTGKSAKKTLKTVSITQDGNRNFTKDIKWVYGVDGPSSETLSKRKPFEYAEWYESDTTKWFGVRKVSYTTDGGYDDTKMCWVITASNMLHWWFTQNENEITQYKQKNNISETENNSNILYYNNNYQRGSVNDEKTKSSFASLLRLGFKNDGNPVRTALTWYLEGKDWEAGGGGIQKINPKILFKDVLSADNSIVTFATLNSQNDVNTLFKNAIENKEAIAVSYEFGGGNYPRGHVVTVWGISLDGDGNVFELWVADSDVGANSQIPYIYNMGIHYGDDGHPKMVNLSNGKATLNKFSDITTLKLGKDRFK